MDTLADKILNGVGGRCNIRTIDSCISRLRFTVKDSTIINKKLLLDETDASKVIIKDDNVQIVYGIHVDEIKNKVLKELQNDGFIGLINVKLILESVGGKENIETITNCISRLRLTLKDVSKVDENTLIQKTDASKVIIKDNNVQIVYGIKVEEITKAIKSVL